MDKASKSFIVVVMLIVLVMVGAIGIFKFKDKPAAKPYKPTSKEVYMAGMYNGYLSGCFAGLNDAKSHSPRSNQVWQECKQRAEGHVKFNYCLIDMYPCK